jgi:biopolymer transport protein ExbD
MRLTPFKKARPSEEMSLQITSMADIFTIILVFLLKSYSTGAVTLSPSGGMQLPQALTGDPPVEALQVEISQTAVQVDGKPIVTLKNFQFDPLELLGNGTSGSLLKAFETQRQKQLFIAKGNSDVKVDARILVSCDQRAPYSAVKAVLASAAVHGYTDFKLAVVRGD